MNFYFMSPILQLFSFGASSLFGMVQSKLASIEEDPFFRRNQCVRLQWPWLTSQEPP